MKARTAARRSSAARAGTVQKRADKWASIAMSAVDDPQDHALSLDQKDDTVDAMRQYVRDGRFSDSFMIGTNGGSTFESVLRPSTAELREVALPSSSRKSPGPGLHSGADAQPRFLVKDTSIIPCRSVGLLKIITKNGEKRWGTAFLIGPRTLATAAHNLLHPKAGAADRIYVCLGYDGVRNTGEWHTTKGNRLSESWLENPTSENPHDFAVLRIEDAEVGNQLGWFGFADYSDEKFTNLAVNLFGYPINDEPRYSMHGSTGRTFCGDTDRIYYDCDVEEGMSGGPVFAKYGDHRIAVGIHVAKDNDGPNVGTRIDSVVFKLLNEHKKW